MLDFLTIIQLTAAVLMVVTILMQSGGAGLGSAFGGGDAYMTKRGAEKTIFRSTIIFAFIFVVLGIVRLFI